MQLTFSLITVDAWVGRQVPTYSCQPYLPGILFCSYVEHAEDGLFLFRVSKLGLVLRGLSDFRASELLRFVTRCGQAVQITSSLSSNKSSELLVTSVSPYGAAG